MLEDKKIALVHHWLVGMRGGEKIVESLCRMFPDIDIFTLVYDKNKISDIINSKKIYTSFIQRMPLSKRKHQLYLPFMPVAVEQFDLSGYDIVISIESGIAKGVLTKPDTCHICYCNTPMRYLWNMYFDYLNNEKMGFLKKSFIRYYFNYLRVWDLATSFRVDYFISNSENVKKRVQKYYRRDSEVIYPPVNLDRFTCSGNKKDYYLAVSQLVSYKRIDIAVDAFNRLDRELVIIGDGPERKRLEKRAGSNIKFIGWQDDTVLEKYYSEAKAFIFPGEEDFGITPVEAQASGTPVIGYGRGGLLETVEEGKTGLFFDDHNAESLMDAVKRFESGDHNITSENARENSRRFDISIFEKEIKSFIMEKYNKYCREYGK
jgi:glycosyltransferase involved in cell wall biosynthesis